ncbi:hypothetical protein E5288_WYG014217 [Bos mutus]|uniref:Uncharacterized protein n=1 Tax=Bos mutus TaxID=72004 RepID=A0A6B0R8Q8_9CETA|nr:hypothetical protein [Bos mutus]
MTSEKRTVWLTEEDKSILNEAQGKCNPENTFHPPIQGKLYPYFKTPLKVIFTVESSGVGPGGAGHFQHTCLALTSFSISVWLPNPEKTYNIHLGSKSIHLFLNQYPKILLQLPVMKEQKAAMQQEEIAIVCFYAKLERMELKWGTEVRTIPGDPELPEWIHSAHATTPSESIRYHSKERLLQALGCHSPDLPPVWYPIRRLSPTDVRWSRSFTGQGEKRKNQKQTGTQLF